MTSPTACRESASHLEAVSLSEMATTKDQAREIERLRGELDVASAMVMRQAADLSDARAEIQKLRPLVTVAIETTRRLRDVINSLTARCNDLRGIQNALLGAGLDEWGRALERAADRIELTFGMLVRVRNRLSVTATGSAEDTLTRASTGEWAVPAELEAELDKRKRQK